MWSNDLHYAPAGYWWASVDKGWEQEKLEARKMPDTKRAAESHPSGARCTLCWLAFVPRRISFFRATLTHGLPNCQLHLQLASMPIPSLSYALAPL